jgi:acyl-CoA thioester hydrolase
MPAPNSRITLRHPPSAPRPFLEEETLVRVRFNEVDAMRVVWHGHYVGYLEEARRAFGRRYGVDYPVMFEHHTPAPVVQLHLDYYAPARMSDMLEVTARLFKSESAKLEFEYEIRRQGETTLLAAGSSVQVFTNTAGELLLNWPPYMVELLKQWEPLWKKP